MTSYKMYTMDSFAASKNLVVFSQNASVHVCDFFLFFFLICVFLSGVVMANSSEEHSGSEEEIPQQSRVADKAKVAERKSAKPPKAPKKKVESESMKNMMVFTQHTISQRTS